MRNEKKCLNCGQTFEMLSVNQKYCSKKCRERYLRNHRREMFYPSITFRCSQCGKTVVTEEGTGDMRTRFCCASCEKKYWRHPPGERPSSLTNFRSVEEYAGYERRSNE